jgi:23S rRNA G2069 N7-methylase RlmK/C1962 C5-methylase RlmI
VYGYSGGAKCVDTVEISEAALSTAKKNIALNGFPAPDDRFITADVFDFLRSSEKKYDCIVLDPPKFAKHKQEVERACRGYKEINLLAFKKLNPEGILFTFSCSQAIDTKLFRRRRCGQRQVRAGIARPFPASRSPGQYRASGRGVFERVGVEGGIMGRRVNG